MSYQENIAQGLSQAWKRLAPAIKDVDAADLRWVILSDQHRGARDGADDFRGCESAYNEALRHYLEHGYHLCLLGDVEELWENLLPRPLKAYPDTLSLERRFHDQGRLVRIYGNHDDKWGRARWVRKYLEPVLPGVGVLEGLAFRLHTVDRTARLFLVHGHQGTLMSDRLSGLARLVVRYVWATWQRITKRYSTQPSEDHDLRDKHNRAMYQWASAQRDLILLTGHTHKPVFLSGQGADEAQERLRKKCARVEREANPEKRQQMEHYLRGAELDVAWQHELEASPEGRRPVYFNAGCCSFSSGNITGLELADGKIRLVRWPQTDGTHVRVESDLAAVVEGLPRWRE